MPDVKDRLNLLGFDPLGTLADQFAKYIRDEMVKSEEIIRDAKIKIE
jgi:tripartite-type tricarboxylate transporter receptor subunit TctC